MRTLFVLTIVGLLSACVDPKTGGLKSYDATPPEEVPEVGSPDDIDALADAPESDALPPDGGPAIPDLRVDTTAEPAPCSGPASQACGMCGTQTRICTAGRWSTWSLCMGEGVCTPNMVRNCGSGGSQSCGGNCQWQPCGNQTCPGASSQACGSCGTQTRTCDSMTGQWSNWSTCSNQGACMPNATRSCGTAGGSQTCGGDCKWGTCSCVGPTSQTCNCTGTQTRTCLDGAWSGWSGCVGGTNTNSDGQNCGSCGHQCTSGSCVGGQCSCGACGACQKCDTSTGVCVANTGAVCPISNGSGACDANGSCKIKVCDPGYVNCGGVCTAEGDHTCGPSCNDCYLPPNTTTPHIDFAGCINHACKITRCTSEGPFCAGCPPVADFGDCNGNWADGCEVDLTSNPNNCGDCGNKCSTCTDGSLLSWCQFCDPTTSPCNVCKKHPHVGGPQISCDH